jgi:hypothetical protein
MHFDSDFERGLAQVSPAKTIDFSSEPVAIRQRQPYAALPSQMKWVNSLSTLCQDPSRNFPAFGFFLPKEFSGLVPLDLLLGIAEILLLGVYPMFGKPA